jgi:hypothetical protein
MPYRIGAKGTNGCGGYPVVKEDGEVVGCHATRAEADAHLQALYANVPDAEKADVAGANPSFTVDPKYPGVGIKRPNSGKSNYRSSIKSKYGKKPKGTRRGRSGDALDNGGAISSGGPGGSLG